jgi:hypothetical protein
MSGEKENRLTQAIVTTTKTYLEVIAKTLHSLCHAEGSKGEVGESISAKDSWDKEFLAAKMVIF